MSDIDVEVRWKGALRFEAVGRAGVAAALDGDGVTAASPVEALVMALAGCMAADVVEILGKMRVPLDALTVRAEGDRRPEPPRRYTAIRLVYRVEGVPGMDSDKLDRAIELSREKYCSVLHTLRPDVDVTIRIESG